MMMINMMMMIMMMMMMLVFLTLSRTNRDPSMQLRRHCHSVQQQLDHVCWSCVVAAGPRGTAPPWLHLPLRAGMPECKTIIFVHIYERAHVYLSFCVCFNWDLLCLLQWSIMPDLYFYRDLEAEAKNAHAALKDEADEAAPVCC